MTMTQISYSWSFSKEAERKLMSMLATRIALRIGGSSMEIGTWYRRFQHGTRMLCKARARHRLSAVEGNREEHCWNAFAKAAFSPARLGSQGLNTLVTTKTFG